MRNRTWFLPHKPETISGRCVICRIFIRSSFFDSGLESFHSRHSTHFPSAVAGVRIMPGWISTDDDGDERVPENLGALQQLHVVGQFVGVLARTAAVDRDCLPTGNDLENWYKVVRNVPTNVRQHLFLPSVSSPRPACSRLVTLNLYIYGYLKTGIYWVLFFLVHLKRTFFADTSQ